MEQPNQLIDFATWQERFCMLNTSEPSVRLLDNFGEDLATVEAAVQATRARNVWSLLEFEGEQLIIAGFTRFNSLGYFLTARPWTDQHLQVSLN